MASGSTVATSSREHERGDHEDGGRARGPGWPAPAPRPRTSWRSRRVAATPSTARATSPPLPAPMVRAAATRRTSRDARVGRRPRRERVGDGRAVLDRAGDRSQLRRRAARRPRRPARPAPAPIASPARSDEPSRSSASGSCRSRRWPRRLGQRPVDRVARPLAAGPRPTGPAPAARDGTAAAPGPRPPGPAAATASPSERRGHVHHRGSGGGAPGARGARRGRSCSPSGPARSRTRGRVGLDGSITSATDTIDRAPPPVRATCTIRSSDELSWSRTAAIGQVEARPRAPSPRAAGGRRAASWRGTWTASPRGPCSSPTTCRPPRGRGPRRR